VCTIWFRNPGELLPEHCRITVDSVGEVRGESIAKFRSSLTVCTKAYLNPSGAMSVNGKAVTIGKSIHLQHCDVLNVLGRQFRFEHGSLFLASASPSSVFDTSKR
jgi:hypothetical protein